MKNYIAATAEHTNIEQPPAILAIHGPASTASAERLAWNPAPGAWEFTLTAKTSEDRTAGQSTLVPGAASASIQWDGRLYAPATPQDLAVAFDATHVARPDQINSRRHQVKQSINANPLSPGADRRFTRCPFQTNATSSTQIEHDEALPDWEGFVALSVIHRFAHP